MFELFYPVPEHLLTARRHADGRGQTSHDTRRVMARSTPVSPTREMLTRIKAPCLLLSGDGDQYNPLEQSEAWRTLLQSAGVKADLHVIRVAPL